MPVRNGKKYACESCVRGHRVSSCTHNERPLKEIAPKGRPQKQCEHCRFGRKTSSQHNKCDCGHKKDKKDYKEKEVDEDDHPVKKEPSDCNCTSPGNECICSRKNKPLSDRLQSSLKRPTVPVKSKSSVDNQVPVVSHNGHHKPSHRFNKLAHTSGAPYPARTASSRSRPHTLHVEPSYTSTELKGASYRSIRDSQDDMYLAMNNIYGGLSKADLKAIIPEENEDGTEANGIEGIDFDKAFPDPNDADPLDTPDVLKWADGTTTSSSWPSLSAVRVPLDSDLVPSPNFISTSGIDMEWPASPTFSPELSPVVNDEIAPAPSNNGSSSSDNIPSLQANILSSSLFAPWSHTNVPIRESALLDSWTYDDLGTSVATTHYSAADTGDDIGEVLAGLKSPMRELVVDSENDAAGTTGSSSPPRAVFLQRIANDDDDEFEEEEDYHAYEGEQGRYDGQWFIPSVPVSPYSNRLANQYSWLM